MLYIPSEVTVGFKKLPDSFTGKKGFITYRELGNKQDKLFNQSNFDNFIDNSFETIQIKNKPLKGFVINKKITHEHNYFGQYSTILIYHPDGFEFEISLSNLMTVMEYSDIHSQEIQQKCILGWYRSYPVLMPINCPLYHEAKAQNSEILEVTDMNKDLVPGRTYYSKKEKNLVYIGREEILKLPDFNNLQDIKSRQGHIFLKNNYEFVSLAKCQAAYSDEIHPDFEYFKQMYQFQKAQVSIDAENINLIKFSINSKLKFIHDEFIDTINQNKDEITEGSKYDKSPDIIRSWKMALLHQFAGNFREIFHFQIYSEEQKDYFNLEIFPIITKSPINPTIELGTFQVKFLNKTFIEQAFYDSNYYNTHPYRNSEVSGSIEKKLHKEFNVAALIQHLNTFFDAYLSNSHYDQNQVVDGIIDFIQQFKFVGIQYSESKGFDFALAHYFMESNEKSSYQDYVLDSTSIIFSDVKEQKMIQSRTIIFNKADSVVLKKLT